MKVFIIIIGILFIVLVIILRSHFEDSQHILVQNESKKTVTQVRVTPEATQQKQQTALFIPYWSINSDISKETGYNRMIYFGISPDQNGINASDQGYKDLSQFVSLVPDTTEKLLVLRMLDSDNTFSILKNKSLEDRIIQQTVALAKQNKFAGVVLDLEVASLPFSSVVSEINEYVARMYSAVTSAKMKFSLTLYGDTFYRIRPYDVASLVSHSDEIFVMAYDFSKANGDPGPNFPLYGATIYGYDFTVMVNDFLNIVPKNKLTFVFGMYGYDWIIDSKNKSIQQAKSLSDLQVKEQFLNSCTFSNCLISRDTGKSAETEITYIDKNGQHHILWFEDMQSVQQKSDFLKKNGLMSTGYWAYSYF